MLCKLVKNVLCSQAQIEHMTTANPAVLIIQDKNIEEKDGLYIRNIEKSYNVSRFCLCCFVINVYIFIAKTRGFRVPSTVVCSFLSRHACTQRRVCSQTREKLLRVRLQRSSGVTRMKKKTEKKNKEKKKRKKNKRAIACAQGCLRCHVTQRFLHDRQGTNAPSSVPQRPLLAAGYSNKNQFSLSDLSPVCLRHKEASTVEERGTDKGWFSPATESESES